MPHIETTDEFLEHMADLIGVYGACKSEDPDGCDNENECCCRVGFMIEMRERLDNAIKNDKLLKDGQ